MRPRLQIVRELAAGDVIEFKPWPDGPWRKAIVLEADETGFSAKEHDSPPLARWQFSSAEGTWRKPAA